MRLLELNPKLDNSIAVDSNGRSVRSQINLNILPGTSSEYVPLFCMNKLGIIDGGTPYTGYFNNAKVKKILEDMYDKKNFDNKKASNLDKFVANYLAMRLKNEDDLQKLKTHMYVIKDILDDYINDRSFHTPKNVVNFSVSNYENIFDRIQGMNHWFIGNLRASNYLLNLGFLSTYNVTVTNGEHTVDFQPLFSFVVKADDIKYLRLCYLTGKPIDTNLLELWMLKGFEDKDTPYKLMKMNYKKYLKEWVDENQIKVVEKEDLTSALFTKIEQPALKTIKERTNWLNEAKTDFFDHLVFKQELEYKRGIILDYDR